MEKRGNGVTPFLQGVIDDLRLKMFMRHGDDRFDARRASALEHVSRTSGLADQ